MTQRHLARVIVAGFIEKDGRLLVIRERVPHDDPSAPVVINQPAGHVEANERITDAVVREVLEETGYRVRPTHLVGVHQVALPDREHMSIAFLFVCELVSDVQERITAPEVVDTLWLTKEEILARTDEHRSIGSTARFQMYFAGHRFPLEVLSILSL